MLTYSPSPSQYHHHILHPPPPDVSSSSSLFAIFRCGSSNGSSSIGRPSLPFFLQQLSRATSSRKLPPVQSPEKAGSTTTTISNHHRQQAIIDTHYSFFSSSSSLCLSTSSDPDPTAAIISTPNKPCPAVPASSSSASSITLRPTVVDAGTQCSAPPSPELPPKRDKVVMKMMESTASLRSSSGSTTELGLIDLGRTGNRRAGSGSSQFSSTGEPRPPALVPRMPGLRGGGGDDHASGTARSSSSTHSGSPERKRLEKTTTAASSAGSSDRKRSEKASSPSPSSPVSSGGQSVSKRMRPSQTTPMKIMPAQYEFCDTRHLVKLISNMLNELVRFNDEIPLKDGRLTRFHSRAPPGISIPDYLQRLATHATLSPPILLSMVYYIDRLCALYPAFIISSLTVHRFLIAAATVASKGLSDSFWTNATYARVGGISLRELALLEMEFLVRVQWRIVPKPEVLVDYYRSLVDRTEGYVLEGGGGSSVSGGSGESDGSSLSTSGIINRIESGGSGSGGSARGGSGRGTGGVMRGGGGGGGDGGASRGSSSHSRSSTRRSS
ncbi:MAG: hypothetical protein M1823_004916 [Watsoniomyces obsoletus]|nr:MAG: hypothetical protein M1823_004916 [Watsoniomyces obsoletus]